MARYIDADALLAYDASKWGFDMRDLHEVLAAQPTADVAPVVHGKWNVVHRKKATTKSVFGRDEVTGEMRKVIVTECYGYDVDQCSICHKFNDGPSFNYCSNCGAKMDLEVEE